MAKYDIDTIRHSTAHLMAHAVMLLYPDKKVQFGIGPVIENGFYYDIDIDHKFSDEDLQKIEEKMQELVKQKIPIERIVMTKEEAIDFFTKKNQPLKVELIKDLPLDAEISCYKQAEFCDLCRGPHVENTSELPPFFKLLHTAGAYWRGDSSRQMLQRIYATSFKDQKELKGHLFTLEEAKKRDHRKLGKDLDLFIFDQHAPASPFFTPKGAFIYNELVNFMRRMYDKYNYQEVITPQIMDVELWHLSGHYDNYKDNMYFTNIDQREFAIKPMNCPSHMLIYKHHKYSYRDLPLRFADFGRIHRYEKSGVVAGLTRVRTFCQDDGHIFISLDGVQEEIATLLEMFFVTYDHFGFDKIKIKLSTRPQKRVGDDKTWDVAENALKEALNKSGKQYQVNEGDGAFYGPKIDIVISDAIGRYHQLGTIQLDFQMPERFDLKFTNSKGEMERPVVIHRALLGSLERFFGVYLEHIAGAYPFWLAPVQAVIVPVNNNEHLEYCSQLYKEFKQHGIRVQLDDRNETMGLKTRETQQAKIPFMLVAGGREKDANEISVRKYGEKNSTAMKTSDVISLFLELNKDRIPKKFQ